MVNMINRSRYFLDIDPELRNRVKAVAALQGKTMKDWLTEAIIEKLEDDIDAREGLSALRHHGREEEAARHRRRDVHQVRVVLRGLPLRRGANPPGRGG